MKRLAALLVLTASCCGTAVAGDTANVSVLGFSEDGKIFAFEEYGVQDGSGFPYANRFYIDTETDRFITGTPVRIRIDDEGASPDDARAKAALAGSKIAHDATLANGFTVAENAVTELSANPHEVTFLPRPVFPPIDDPVGLRLEEIDFKTSDNCLGFDTLKGFRLSRFAPDTPGSEHVLSTDSDIPASRNCPIGYGIGKVVTHYPESGEAVMAVVIAVKRVGFEGPDYRWIAVTGSLR